MSHLHKAMGGGKEPFVRPFMAWQGIDHYGIDITEAKTLVSWQPHRRLDATLPKIVEALKRDPKIWYKANDVAMPSQDEF